MMEIPTEVTTKPAILAKTGTTSTISFTERPQPQSKQPSINLEQARRRAAVRKEQERLKKKQKEEISGVEEDRAESETSSASLRFVDIFLLHVYKIILLLYTRYSNVFICHN